MAHLDDLLAKVVDGDRAAFRALYDATSAKLLSVILTVVFDQREAEDILQETFVKVWVKAASFNSARGRPMTWLITIARNRAIDRLRRRPAATSVDLDRVVDLADLSPGADVLTFATRDARRLSASLAKLPPHTAAAIHSAYFDGLEYEAIAARDNIPVGTIKSWVRRGLHQMRADLTIDAAAMVAVAAP